MPAYQLLDADGRLRGAARTRPVLVGVGAAGALLLFLGLVALSGNSARPFVLESAYPARPLASDAAYIAPPFRLSHLFDDDFIASLDTQLARWASSREAIVDTGLGLLQYRRIYQVGGRPQLDENQQTFVTLNPRWRYEYFRDDSMDDYVASTFAQVPAIVAIYRAFPRA